MKHRIHVCALRDVSRTAAAIGAGHLVSAIEAPAVPFTPKGIPRDRHLKLDVDDITQPKPAKILPSERHVIKLLDFVADWDQNSPLLIHCFAGIHRTGPYCAVYRMEYEGWSPAEAIEEIRAGDTVWFAPGERH